MSFPSTKSETDVASSLSEPLNPSCSAESQQKDRGVLNVAPYALSLRKLREKRIARCELEECLNVRIIGTLTDALEGEDRWRSLAIHVAAARILDNRGVGGLQVDLEHYTQM